MIYYIAHSDWILKQSRADIVKKLNDNLQITSICPLDENSKEIAEIYSSSIEWNISRTKLFDLIGVINLRKIIQELNKDDILHVFTIKTLFLLIISSLFFIFNWNLDFNLLTIFLIFLIAILNVGISINKFIGLRYLDASTIFINLRLGSSILIVILGYIFLNEALTYLQILGFIAGLIVFFLLYDKKTNTENNYKKGFIYLFSAILFLGIVNIFNKQVSLSTENYLGFIFLFASFSFISFLLFNIKHIKSKIIKKFDTQFCIRSVRLEKIRISIPGSGIAIDWHG